MGSSVRSLVSLLTHPTEIYCLMSLKRRSGKQLDTSTLDPDWQFCFDSLNKVSRSFAMVIRELDAELRNPVCIFYLVLRGLDTVEDDTSMDSQKRMKLCKEFHKVLQEKGWNTKDYGKGGEKELLQNFHTVINCFRSLPKQYQNIITDITKEMGAGMAKFIMKLECKTTTEYDEYCHYVAGLVGIGLTRMFCLTKEIDETYSRNDNLSNSMGLFLQKTNIIRDYLEDLEEGRTFWPREVWELYASNLEDFKRIDHVQQGLHCLNHLVTDALRHVPECLEYLSGVKSGHVFNFVSIPQVMAIATLTECYNNPQVFRGKVKMRRGITARLIMKTTNMKSVYKTFYEYAVVLQDRIPSDDPNASLSREILGNIISRCVAHVPMTPDLTLANRISLVLFAILSAYLLHRRKENAGEGTIWRRGGVPQACDVLAVAAFFAVMIYLLTFFGLQFVKPHNNTERVS
eukprot:jgi/Galph1/3112/GphlegSOOS_G1794.1